MPHVIDASFDWLEGSRTFSIVFGTLTAGACLALAVPLLAWSLPGSRVAFFPKSADPRGLLQLAYGVLCMSMAFADALCRYIPHRPLGLVHPAFFLTTLALVAFLGPRIVALLRAGGTPRGVPSTAAALASILAVLFVFPVATVVNAFWP